MYTTSLGIIGRGAFNPKPNRVVDPKVGGKFFSLQNGTTINVNLDVVTCFLFVRKRGHLPSSVV